MQLTADAVDAVFRNCLAPEDASDVIAVEGCVSKAIFSKPEIDVHEDLIMSMLNELPQQFFPNSGGGWSFLQACQDRHGRLWTGEHRIVEYLVLLGMGIGRVKWLFPRAMWQVLPGGMPYFLVTDQRQETTEASHEHAATE